MDRSEVAYLIKETYSQDDIGQYVAEETRRKVYVSIRSVTRAEWFEAGRNGMNPSFSMAMFEPDYQGEKVVEYHGKRYGVYRTYRAKNETLELYLEEQGGIA